MSDKQIKTLFIILVVVGAIWLGMQYFDRKNQAQISTEGKIDLPLQESEVKKIEITLTDKPVKMQKKDNIWFIETDKPLGTDRSKEADVATLLKILEPTNIKLVSTNPNKHTDLGLDGQTAGTIKFYNDSASTDPNLVILVSKTNPKLFRQNDMTNVYEWSSDLSRIVSQTTESWVAPSPTPTISESTPSAK